MTINRKLLGFAVGASLIIGFEPAAMALPVAASAIGAEAAVAGDHVEKTVTRAGAAHRSTRRTARRVNRR